MLLRGEAGEHGVVVAFHRSGRIAQAEQEKRIDRLGAFMAERIIDDLGPVVSTVAGKDKGLNRAARCVRIRLALDIAKNDGRVRLWLLACRFGRIDGHLRIFLRVCVILCLIIGDGHDRHGDIVEAFQGFELLTVFDYLRPALCGLVDDDSVVIIRLLFGRIDVGEVGRGNDGVISGGCGREIALTRCGGRQQSINGEVVKWRAIGESLRGLDLSHCGREVAGFHRVLRRFEVLTDIVAQVIGCRGWRRDQGCSGDRGCRHKRGDKCGAEKILFHGIPRAYGRAGDSAALCPLCYRVAV